MDWWKIKLNHSTSILKLKKKITHLKKRLKKINKSNSVYNWFTVDATDGKNTKD